MKVLIIVFLSILTACGTNQNKPSTKEHTHVSKNENVSPSSDEVTIEHYPEIPSEYNGYYIHKKHQLAAPIYEFTDGAYRSIEIIGTKKNCILADFNYGRAVISSENLIYLQPLNSKAEEEQYNDHSIKLSEFMRTDKIEILRFLCDN